MKKSIGVLRPAINRYVAVLSIALAGGATLLTPTMTASAASRGYEATCSFISSTRLQCGFPILAASYNAEIHYFSAQCNSTGVAFNLQQLQIVAIPPNGGSTAVDYQVAGNRASVAGVVNAAGNVAIHVQLNTSPAAVIDLAPAPTGTTSCTASISVIF